MDLSRERRQEQDDEQESAKMETTRTILKQLQDALAEKYAAQLAQFGPPRSPAARKEREALVNGFKDGLQHGMRHVCDMLDVKITE